MQVMERLLKEQHYRTESTLHKIDRKVTATERRFNQEIGRTGIGGLA